MREHNPETTSQSANLSSDPCSSPKPDGWRSSRRTTKAGAALVAVAMATTAERSADARTAGMLTLAEAAVIARTPVASLRRWIADDRLKAVRPGRRVLITRRALAAALGVAIDDLI